MTRTNETAGTTNDGRDSEWLRQRERAATFAASAILTDRYIIANPSHEER